MPKQAHIGSYGKCVPHYYDKDSPRQIDILVRLEQEYTALFNDGECGVWGAVDSMEIFEGDSPEDLIELVGFCEYGLYHVEHDDGSSTTTNEPKLPRKLRKALEKYYQGDDGIFMVDYLWKKPEELIVSVMTKEAIRNPGAFTRDVARKLTELLQ